MKQNIKEVNKVGDCMKEIKEKYNIEKIESNGLDKSLLRKRGNAKTYAGWLIQRIKEARDSKNMEAAIFLQELYKKYMEFEKSEKIKVERWKGKSGIKLLEEPDKFICISYKKDEKDSEPKEIKREILKTDLNDLITVINSFKDKDKIPTSALAERLYKIKWKKVFSDRMKHTNLVLMLNILEQRGNIIYSRKGFTKVIKNLDYFNLIIK